MHCHQAAQQHQLLGTDRRHAAFGQAREQQHGAGASQQIHGAAKEHKKRFALTLAPRPYGKVQDQQRREGRICHSNAHRLDVVVAQEEQQQHAGQQHLNAKGGEIELLLGPDAQYAPVKGRNGGYEYQHTRAAPQVGDNFQSGQHVLGCQAVGTQKEIKVGKHGQAEPAVQRFAQPIPKDQVQEQQQD